MSERRVVVIGSGASGTAAALAARAAGARVTMIFGRTGATSLGSGALDGDAHDDAKTALDALGGCALGTSMLATSAGTLRASTGRDLALADLGAGSGAVLVARVNHPAWDADALAASYAELDVRGFVARDVGLVLHTDERVMHHAELAARHDDTARLARAAERIRAALAEGGTFSTVLVPPWLGASRPRAAELSALAGIACGEVLVSIDGPAGMRFEHARDRCLQNASIELVSDRARRVTTSKGGCVVELGSGKVIDTDAVVLATGGVLAGGIAYTPGDAVVGRASSTPQTAFELGYEAPVLLGRDGHRLMVPGSVFGSAPETLTWPTSNTPALERIGIMVDARGRAAERIYVAGDAIEGRARTMLAALASGTAAGRAAASRASTESRAQV